MPSTSAFDCLGRSIANLRANWELIPVYLAQQVGVMVLTLLSLVVLVLPVWMSLVPGLLGPGGLEELDRMSPAELEQLLMEVLFALPDLLAPLAVGLLLGTLVGGVALFVSCWFSAGVFATLCAGDGRVPAVGAPQHRAFRVFTPGGFIAAGNRLAWRYFWFVNLCLVYVLLVVLAWTLVLVPAGWSYQLWGWPAAVGVALAGSLPPLMLLVVLTAWMWLGLAELGRGDAGVRRTARRAAELLRRRPAAAGLFLVLALGASLLVGLGTTPVDLGTSAFLHRALAPWCGLQVLIFTLQLAASAVISLVMAGAFVALVRSETPVVNGAPA